MEQQTGSKLGKKYVKAVYCHPAYLTSMQSTSRETLGWMSGLSQCTSFECPASCIELGLVIYFTYGNIHVSMLFFQIIPPPPSPTEYICHFLCLPSSHQYFSWFIIWPKASCGPECGDPVSPLPLWVPLCPQSYVSNFPMRPASS